MKVNLKRANSLARAMEKAVREMTYDTTVRLSIYSPALNTAIAFSTTAVTEEYKKARSNMLNQHELTMELTRARFAIRQELAEANMTLGISERLTNKERLSAEEARLRILLKTIETDTSVERSAEAVQAKARAIRDQPNDRYMGREDTVVMAAYTDEDVANVRRDIKRVIYDRSLIDDQLTALNVSNSITLNSSIVAILRRAELVPAE